MPCCACPCSREVSLCIVLEVWTELFFRSPIDPFDLSKDWGRSDNDQRRRLVINESIRMRVLR